MMLEDAKREVARDLLEQVHAGQLAPEEADEAAFFAGFSSLSKVPSPDEYWPTSKRHWTLPMVLAWISWRTFSEVREWDADYVPLRMDWGPLNQRGAVEGAIGHGLFTRRRPTSAQFLRWGSKRFGPWVMGRDGHPALFSEASPAEAMSALRRSLEGGELVAHGVCAAGAPRVEIPAYQWLDIEIVPGPDGDEVLRCGAGANRLTYREVLFPWASIAAIWPDHPRSGLPDQADFGLSKIDDPDAWSALYARVEPSALYQEPPERRVRAARASMEPCFRDLEAEQERLVAAGILPWTEKQTEHWGRRWGFTREEVRKMRERLRPELKRSRGQTR